ncbi:Polysaccharide lyase family 8, C-terminal beta-sandwich domain [Mariniphaga anaerophila]|uniref:Polysaccharide lyase family 8, C-terminal beta-sandwich domain n=1 Tax=Mariniphaga anaerophila TaxID=1484053 RepID=A0A1M4WK04_9BACT|nr:polysaccharide lyase family 8 super-sandwich domain-containing protein [Mariniphaga anaerophila]SHE81631.1 Polysaccharide lyase family 8, C-terminal beta-sandwich domain [Mariniphaga anaerophila]
MKFKPVLFITIFALCAFATVSKTDAQEKIFASYFDISTNSSEGTEVIGRIHLERNKDVLKSPVPKGYHFEIENQDGNLFEIETRYDLHRRIMGVLTVSEGQNTGETEKSHQLTVLLKNGNEILNRFPVEVRIVETPLWNVLFDRYKDFTVSSKGSRMYGRTIFSDKETAAKIIELENNNGRFNGFKCYTRHPEDYLGETNVDPLTGRVYGTIEYEWEQVAKLIGGLGYAYARSEKYGPSGDAASRERLKKAMYKAIIAYTACVPIEGNDVYVNGKPIGEYTGDGFANLVEHKMMGHQVCTHQWVISDPLVAPAVHLMPDLLAEMKEENNEATEVYNALVQFYQVFTSIIKQRRAIDDPSQRWGEIQDTIYSEGAWADANLGHRLRIMLALPIIWADYNRPMTYVQYWYSDFYNDKPFKNFSFSPGWSPHGVVPDVRRWMTKFDVPAHEFAQSGFQPDGTVSHHIGKGTDAPMIAYGFGWLTEPFVGFHQFKDTPFRLEDKYFQFPADRLLHVYGRLIYKNRFDFTIAGRSYLSDMEKFVTVQIADAIDELLESKSRDNKIENETELLALKNNIQNNSHHYSGTDAYWVNEFLVHRRENENNSFYSSVKLKSERAVGAEDFDRVRKSWHSGSGVLQLRTKGDEYSQQVLKNMDWHMLPGITEEWRTDPLPAKGGAQACLPGLNKIAGVLSDGKSGMAMYHHLPRETYSTATALKSYHFIGNKIIALGSNIQRNRAGQGKGISTCIDQAGFTSKLTCFVNGKVAKIGTNQSVDIHEKITQPCWFHTGDRGFVIFQKKECELVIKTGKSVNTTDTRISNNAPNYIIAVGHGVNPGEQEDNNYFYLLLPNVSAEDMPGLVSRLANELNCTLQNDSIHSVYAKADSITQIAFYAPGKIKVNKKTIECDNTAMVMLKENQNSWTVSVGDPTADVHKEQITLRFSTPLKEGKYSYTVPGIYPREGEFAEVKREGNNSVITVEMPDARDEAYYNYQSVLYSGVPVVLNIPKGK